MGDTATDAGNGIEAMMSRVQALEAELACARAALTVESSRVLADGSGEPVGYRGEVGLVAPLSAFTQGGTAEDGEESLPAIMLQPLQRYDALRRKWKLERGLPYPAAACCPCPSGVHVNNESGRLRLLGLLADGRPWEQWVTFRELLREGGITLGRDPEASDIVLDDDSVSRVHARLELVAMGVVISDIHSTNGLMVNDAEVNAYAPQVTVVHGSVLQVGEVPLRAEFFTS